MDKNSKDKKIIENILHLNTSKVFRILMESIDQLDEQIDDKVEVKKQTYYLFKQITLIIWNERISVFNSEIEKLFFIEKLLSQLKNSFIENIENTSQKKQGG